MSKSDKDVKSRIELIDPPEVIREKIKKAVTDAHASISYNPEKRQCTRGLGGGGAR
jgi:tryptophanyl-tRNA synthetase